MLHAGTRCSRVVGSQPFVACKAGAQHIGCSLGSKPFFGVDTLAYSGRRVLHRQLRSATVTMAKVDDPSQAFHSGQAKARSALDEMSSTGEFKRTDSTYRDHIKKGTRFEPEGTSLQGSLNMPLSDKLKITNIFYRCIAVLCIL